MNRDAKPARRWIPAVLLWAVVAASGLFALGVAGAVWVSRTASGRELALEWALEKARPAVNGSLSAGSIGPGGLLGGATLHDVQLHDSTGHLVIAADSIQARYSVAGLIGGSRSIADLDLWGVVVDLAPAEGGQVSLGSLVATGDNDPEGRGETADGPRSDEPALRIRDVSIRDAAAILRAADGSRRRVHGIAADLPVLDVLPSPGLYLSATVEEAALVYPIGTGDLDLSGIAGEIEVGEERTVLDADRFLLPGSEGAGRLEARPDGDRLRTRFDLRMTRLALADLYWIEERFDHGVARGGIGIVNEPNGPRIELRDVEADLGAAGRIAFNGALVRAGSLELSDLSVEAERFATAELERFLPAPLPVAGVLSGEVNLDGGAGRLGIAGNLALITEAGTDTLVHLSGSGTTLGAGSLADVNVRAGVLDYSLLEAIAPGPRWQGTGDMTIRADGALETGIAIEVAANHSAAGSAASTLAFTGSVYGDTAIEVVDLDATVRPLSLSTLGRLFPDLPLEGSVEGSFSLRGGMDRLTIAADLDTDAGPLQAEGIINARDLGAGYEMLARSDGFNLSRVLAGVPDPTIVSGTAALNGSGVDLVSLRGAWTLNAGSSSIGALQVDTAAMNAWVDEEGLLHVESVYADAAGVQVRGSGNIGAAPGVRGDGVTLSLRSPSIAALRDVFMGPDLVAWDELSPIEQDLMIEVDGVDPDTVPRARDIRFAGRVDGSLHLAGGLDDLSAEVEIAFADLVYGRSSARSLDADLTVTGIAVPRPDSLRAGPSPAQRSAPGIVVAGAVTGDAVTLWDREFDSASIEGDLAPDTRSRLRALIQRSDRESYDLQAVVQLDDRGGRIDLDRFTLLFEDRRWNLRGPARFEWNPDAIVVRDFGLIRPGGDGLRLSADGRLSRGETDSDLELRVDALDLGTLGRLLQLETPPSGTLAAQVNAGGPGDDPEWETTVRLEDAGRETLSFDSVTVSGSFADYSLATEVESWTRGRRTIHVAGTVPLDLRLASVAQRMPDAPVALEIVADSFPASMILGTLSTLEEVDGTLSGSVTLGGRPTDLEPDGSLRLEDVSALMTPFAVRFSSTNIAMELSPDGVVGIEGSAVSGGTMEVRGTMDLGRMADSIPLDLTFRPAGFQVVDRADMEAAITSEAVTLTGSFDFPYIEGAVDVEGGTVFMEEFQRTAEVVDLYDPALFSAATLSIGSGEPAGDEGGAGERIPFLQNLRVFIDMRVGNGNWLRSRDMNIETAGDLAVTFDRQRNQLILAGEMEVVRGTLSLGPRTMRMTEGTFQFPGTPGFNPGLTITAENRIRTREGQPLVITANVSGTLLEPALAFSGDAESSLSEADLINYLFLGQPTSALLGDAGAASVGAGTNLLLSQVANEIGYILAQELELDHLSLSQAEQGQANAAFGTSSLQLEVGKYILENVFVTGVYQRGFCADPTLPVSSGGVRVEVAMPREVRLEGFLEGRCTRERYRGLGDASLELESIWGFLLFREWGY